MARGYQIDEEEFRPEGPEGNGDNTGGFTGGENTGGTFTGGPAGEGSRDDSNGEDVDSSYGSGNGEGQQGQQPSPTVTSTPRPANNAVSVGGDTNIDVAPVSPVPRISGPIGHLAATRPRLFGMQQTSRGIWSPRAFDRDTYNSNDPGQTSISQLIAALVQRKRGLF